jgi:hypothetical protein
MMPVRKEFKSTIRIKDAAKGEVSAVFSTFNVIDKDGDVTPPDAIQDGAPIVVSAYGHQSWAGMLPVGKGVIRTTESEAIADMQFFMDTSHGADAFNTVAELAKSGLGEWSYGFDILDAAPGVFDGKDVLFLNAVKVHEVSPVMEGAGVNTRTLATKSAKERDGMTGDPYKAAIRPHPTKSAAGEWNASKVIKGIPADSSVSDLRSVFAWCDPNGDPENKGSYKFPHHDAVKGDANIRACITGIAVLNGARGAAGIPEADRRGVYNHLVSHLEEAKREVPELRANLNIGSLKFSDECAAVLASVSDLILRAQEIAVMRAAKGRTMSHASVEMLEWLNDEIKNLKSVIDTPQEDLAREAAIFTLMEIQRNTNA